MKFVPSLSRPCPQDWNAMTGTDQRRFCDHCQLHVHNLSAMTHGEQAVLLSGSGTRKCVAYFAGKDAIRIRSGTWLLLQRFLRPWRAGLALLAVLLPSGFSGCATSQPQPPPPAPETHDCKQVREIDDKMWLGGIMYEPPLWERVLFFWR